MAFDFGILQPFVNDAMITEKQFIQHMCTKEKAEQHFWSLAIWSSC